MAELSWFWDGTSTGDATSAPYSSDEFSDFIASLFLTDRTLQGVLKGTVYTGELALTNPGGTTLRVASGAAIVDGKLYTSTASTDFSCATIGYYNVVLRKNFAAQTVRLALLGPGGGVPAVTQIDGTTWEISLASVYSTGAVLTITDARSFIPKVSSSQLVGTITYAQVTGHTWDLIAETIIGVGGGIVDWLTIPATYRELIIKIHAKSMSAPGGSVLAFDDVHMRYNADAGANYRTVYGRLISAGPAWSTGYAAAQTRIIFGAIPAESNTNGWGDIEIHIPRYADTNNHKNASIECISTSDTSDIQWIHHNGVWQSTAAINRIQLQAGDLGLTGVVNFTAGSIFTLYGVK